MCTIACFAGQLRSSHWLVKAGARARTLTLRGKQGRLPYYRGARASPTIGVLPLVVHIGAMEMASSQRDFVSEFEYHENSVTASPHGRGRQSLPRIKAR